MRDKEIGEAKFILQVHHQVEHLRLDGDIERDTGSSATMPLNAWGKRCICSAA